MTGVEIILELQKADDLETKKNIIKEYADEEEFRNLLYFALNPFISYNIPEKVLRTVEEDEIRDLPLVFFDNFLECCEFLSRLRGMDDATVRQVWTLLYHHCNESEREVYIEILSKSLQLGVTPKFVNEIIPELLPDWDETPNGDSEEEENGQ